MIGLYDNNGRGDDAGRGGGGGDDSGVGAADVVQSLECQAQPEFFAW